MTPNDLPEYKGKVVRMLDGGHCLLIEPTGKPLDPNIMARLEIEDEQ